MVFLLEKSVLAYTQKRATVSLYITSNFYYKKANNMTDVFTFLKPMFDVLNYQENEVSTQISMGIFGGNGVYTFPSRRYGIEVHTAEPAPLQGFLLLPEGTMYAYYPTLGDARWVGKIDESYLEEFTSKILHMMANEDLYGDLGALYINFGGCPIMISIHREYIPTHLRESLHAKKEELPGKEGYYNFVGCVISTPKEATLSFSCKFYNTTLNVAYPATLEVDAAACVSIAEATTTTRPDAPWNTDFYYCNTDTLEGAMTAALEIRASGYPTGLWAITVAGVTLLSA